MPNTGDRRFVADWWINIVLDDDGVVEDLSKYGQKICSTLEEALIVANSKDVNREGRVYEEEYNASSFSWDLVNSYNSYGEICYQVDECNW